MRSNEWVTINIEKHHIELGKQNDCNECPIALAIREEMCGRNLVANVRDGEDVTLITKMDMKGVWAVVDIHSEDNRHYYLKNNKFFGWDLKTMGYSVQVLQK